MSSSNHSHKPQSWEHLLEKDPHSGAGFRVGVVAAALIHAGIFAVTWPTVAQAPPEAPEEVLYRVPLSNFVPERPEPEPIRVDVRVRPPQGPPVVSVPPEEVALEPSIIDEPPPTGPVVVVAPPDPPPPPPDPPPTIVRADFDIDAPEITFKVEPRYNEPARHAGIEGVVILELVIDTDGAVESVKVHRGLPFGLTRNAVEAVKQWRFAPSTYNGHPVAVRYILTVRFNLT